MNMQFIIAGQNLTERIFECGKLNEEVDPGLTHLRNGDLRLSCKNDDGCFDTLFEDADLIDSIEAKVTVEGETLFEGVVVNSTIEFDRWERVCSFNVFSFSKVYWEKLDRVAEEGHLWGLDECYKVVMKEPMFDIFDTIKKLLIHYCEIEEANISIDPALQEVYIPGFGPLSFNQGLSLSLFHYNLGELDYPLDAGGVYVQLNPSDRVWEGMKEGDCLRVFDSEVDAIAKIQDITYLWDTERPLRLYVDKPLSKDHTFQPVGGDDPAQAEFIPQQDITIKEILGALEFALAGVFEFGNGTASFTSIYTKLEGDFVSLDPLNPDRQWSEYPVPKEHRAFAFAWKRNIPYPDHQIVFKNSGCHRESLFVWVLPGIELEDNAAEGWVLEVRDDNGFMIYLGKIVGNVTVGGGVRVTVTAFPSVSLGLFFNYRLINPNNGNNEYYAFVESNLEERDLYYEGELPAFCKVEESPYIFAPDWIAVGLNNNPYQEYLTILNIVLLKGYYIYTKVLRRLIETTIDISTITKPFAMTAFAGYQNIITKVDTDLRTNKQASNIEMIHHWEQNA